MDRFLDLNHPFFRPVWIRALVVAACLGWAAFEFLGPRGSPFWGILFAAIGLYAAYAFFLNFHPREPDK